MHILMVSKACLVGAYQTKLEHIARFPEIELTVIVPPTWRDAAGEIRLERNHTNGYRLLVDPIRFNGSYHFHYYPRLGARLRALRPDILHMDEEPYNIATWHAMRQAGRVGARTLFFSWQNIWQRYPWVFRRLEQEVLDRADYAIVGSRAAEEVWRRKGYGGPTAVIPQFGVSPDHFAPPKERDPGRAFEIGSAGRRLVPEKGLDILIRAVAGLPGSWRLNIAGDGPERRSLAQLASEHGVADRVSFDGVIPSSQMAAYLRQLDVMVLPSRTMPNWKEQFGRALVEAMACEVAVIGSDSGEIPYVIGDAGLVFPENDVDALRVALQRVMQTEGLREQLGRAGRARVLARFTQEQVAARTVAVYREMMGK